MTDIPDVRVGDTYIFEYPNEPQFNCELTVTRIDWRVADIGESLVHFNDWSHSKLKHMGSIKRKAHVPWTFEEIVAHYRKLGETNAYFAKAIVWERSKLDNTDPSVKRGATCMCGSCWDSKVCACGQDRVGNGKDCVTCGRPWWCER